MPLMNGIDTTGRLRDAWSEARVVVLPAHTGHVQTHRALQGGVTATFLEHRPSDALVDTRRKRDVLTPREVEVLTLVALGSSNKRVGAALGVTEDTVKAHMKAIMRKLDAIDRTHAVTLALLRGSIDPRR